MINFLLKTKFVLGWSNFVKIVLFLKSNIMYVIVLSIIGYGFFFNVLSFTYAFSHKVSFNTVFFINVFAMILNLFTSYFNIENLIIKWRKIYENIPLTGVEELYDLNYQLNKNFVDWCKDNKIKVECFWVDNPDKTATRSMIVKNMFGYKNKLILVRLKI